MFGIATKNEIEHINKMFYEYQQANVRCRDEDVKAWNKEIELLRNSISDLRSTPSLGTDYAQRLIELEAKTGKLWQMLVEVSPTTGKEKLSRLGRTFGGRSTRHNL